MPPANAENKLAQDIDTVLRMAQMSPGSEDPENAAAITRSAPVLRLLPDLIIAYEKLAQRYRGILPSEASRHPLDTEAIALVDETTRKIRSAINV